MWDEFARKKQSRRLRKMTEQEKSVPTLKEKKTAKHRYPSGTPTPYHKGRKYGVSSERKTFLKSFEDGDTP